MYLVCRYLINLTATSGLQSHDTQFYSITSHIIINSGHDTRIISLLREFIKSIAHSINTY